MLVEGFGGGLPGEGLAGAVVEGEGDGLELVDAPARQVRALRKVLPESAGTPEHLSQVTDVLHETVTVASRELGRLA